jgi:hypothetical protein
MDNTYMRELLIFTIYAVAIVALALVFTIVDRRFPKVRIPYIYQERLALNILVNVIYVTIIFLIAQKVLF